MGNFWTDFFDDVQECKAYATKAEREACMIRKGFRQTGPETWSRTTGTVIDPSKVVQVAASAIPAVGAVVGAVGAVQGKTPVVAPKPMVSPPPSSSASSSTSPIMAGIDPATLFLLLGALVFVAFSRR